MARLTREIRDYVKQKIVENSLPKNEKWMLSR